MNGSEREIAESTLMGSNNSLTYPNSVCRTGTKGQKVNLVACPICCCEDLSVQYPLHDDRYGCRQAARLMLCGACGHKFLNPPLEAKDLETLYTRYYQRDAIDPADFEPYKLPGKFRGWLEGDFSSAANWVPGDVRVLDIGCGLGANVAFHASRGCDAHGVDADANVRVIAEKYNLNVRVGLFDPKNYESGYFDYVTMDQVFEHVSDPLSTLTNVRDVLKSGGCLVISTPNANGWGRKLFGRRWLNWHVPYHQQFVSRQSMTLLAEKTGFAVERMVTTTRSAWLIFQIAHLLTYPSMGDASVFWAPKKGKLRLHQLVLLKLIMATRLTLVPQLITRLFDYMGHGDNYLVILRKE